MVASFDDAILQLLSSYLVANDSVSLWLSLRLEILL